MNHLIATDLLHTKPSHLANSLSTTEAPSTVAELLERCTDTFSSRIAYDCQGETLTYLELNRQSRDFAAFLGQQLGLRPESRIVLHLLNTQEFMVALCGIVRAGMVAVPIDSHLHEEELWRQPAACGAAAILTSSSQRTGGKNRVVVIVSKEEKVPSRTRQLDRYFNSIPPISTANKRIPFEEALSQGRNQPFIPPESQPDDPVIGGYPAGGGKANDLTNRDVLQQLKRLTFGRTGLMVELILWAVTPSPLTEIFSLLINGLLLLHLGGRNVLIPHGHDTGKLLATLRAYPLTFICGRPALFERLLRHVDFDARYFRQLRVTLSADDPLPRELGHRWETATGCRITDISHPSFPLVPRSPLTTDKRINIAGYRVFPSDVEKPIARHRKVARVTAVGTPDPDTIEAVKVFVVRADPTLTRTELLDYCRDCMSPHKVPRDIIFYSN